MLTQSSKRQSKCDVPTVNKSLHQGNQRFVSTRKTADLIGAATDPSGTKTESTSAGEQHVIPGAEEVSDAEVAKRKAREPLKPKVGQKPADEGLFGDWADQTDFVDLAAKP